MYLDFDFESGIDLEIEDELNRSIQKVMVSLTLTLSMVTCVYSMVSDLEEFPMF